MKTIAFSLLLAFASLEHPFSAALVTQPGPSLTYEEFVRLPPESRDEVYRQLSADTKAAFLRKRFDQWLTENRGQLSSRQVAAVREAINLVTPELFQRAPDAKERARQDAVSKKLRCSLGSELAYSFAQGQAAPVIVERTWTQVLASWTEWIVDCV
jgi:hypothetical protein